MADLAHARQGRRALRAAARGQRDDVGARVRPPLPARAERAVRGGGRTRPADRERARGLRPQPAPRARGHARARPTRRAAKLLERWHGRGRLRYAVTPRFSVSCTEADARRPAGRCSTSSRPRCSRATSTRARARSSSSSSCSRRRATTSAPTRTPGCSASARCSPTTSTCPTTSCTGSPRAHRRRALPVEQRVPVARDLPHGPPRRARRALRDGHRRRRRHGPEHAQGGPRRLPRADGPRPGPHARPGAPALPRDRGGRDGARPRRARRRPHARQAADLLLLRPPAGSTLEAVLEDAPAWSAALGAIFTLAREECVLEVRVAGDVVFCARIDQDEVVAVHGFLGRPREAPRAPRRTSSP